MTFEEEPIIRSRTFFPDKLYNRKDYINKEKVKKVLIPQLEVICDKNFIKHLLKELGL